MTEDRRVRGDALLGEGVAEGTIDFRLATVGEEAALEVGVTRSVLMAVGGVFRTGVLLALTAVGALLAGVLLGRVAEGGLFVDVAVLALLVAAVEVRAPALGGSAVVPGLIPSPERSDFLLTEEVRLTTVEPASVIV